MRININTKESLKNTSFSWQKCIGNDHAFQMHRSDMLEHLTMLNKELGFEYIRFHGILNDDMLTYQKLSDLVELEAAQHVGEYNFHQVGHVYDNVLKAGMRPVVELSFMPSNLASGTKTMLHYKANITPPKDYNEWAKYISSFIQYLIHRYGIEEIRSRYFEVWNEPDLDTFWSGTQEEYFKLYRYTVTAIKQIDNEIQVGGPSTSKNRWIQDFIDYCRTYDLPYDFISTHHYPGVPFGNTINNREQRMIDAIKKGRGKDLTTVNRDMFYYPENLDKIEKGMLSKQSDQTREIVGDQTKVFYTEWNSIAVFGAEVHDTKYSAAFLTKTIMDLNDQVDMYSFWCASDMFEEIFFLQHPFNGSFGLISIDGIPKPNFWAFKLLSKLLPQRYDFPIRTNEDVEYAVFTDGNTIQILLYAQSMTLSTKQHTVTLQINETFNAVSVEAIDDNHCNPLAEWKKYGSPKNLTRNEINEIKEVSKLVSEECAFEQHGNETMIHVSIATNDVILLTCTK